MCKGSSYILNELTKFRVALNKNKLFTFTESSASKKSRAPIRTFNEGEHEIRKIIKFLDDGRKIRYF